MHKTNSTSGTNSAMQSNSYVQKQYDLFDEDHHAHNPDELIIEQVFEHYHNTLKINPELIEYIIRRKIDPDYIDLFQIGFVNRTLGSELQPPSSLVGSRNRGHLQRLGIIKDTGHPFFLGSFVTPYHNAVGHITGAYGRRPRHQRTSPAYHLYWNAHQASLFNAADCQLSKTRVLTKSYMDALTLLTAGFGNVVATMGVKGFNEVQLSQLEEEGVTRVYIAFDNTPSANHYAMLVAQALDAVGIQCYRVKLPPGHDVNSFALGQSDVANAFSKLMEKTVPFKLRYRELLPDTADHWQDEFEMLEDCMQFYLDEFKYSGKSTRLLRSVRNHLMRFREYCQAYGVERVCDVTPQVLESYHQYLRREKNAFTGEVISLSTQEERISAVNQMLARLHYYGVIPEQLSFSANIGVMH